MSRDLPAFNRETTIDEYIDDLENFMLAHHGQCSDDRKRAALLTAIGPEAKKVIANFSQEDKASYSALCTALKNHYKVRKHIYVERHTFFSMFMEDGEPIDKYLTRLRCQAAKCDFRVLCRPTVPATENAPEQSAVYHDITNEFIRDRLIVTINDNEAKSKLMQKQSLTLDDVVTFIKATERANEELKRILDEQSSSINSIGLARKKPRLSNPSPSDSNKPQKDKGEVYLCTRYCGTRHTAGKCPAYGKICQQCGKQNHYKTVCRRRKYENNMDKENAVNTINQESPESMEDDNESLFLGTISCNVRQCQATVSELRQLDWFETLTLNGKTIRCKIDTGAQLNVMSAKKLREKFGNVNIHNTKIKLKAYNETDIPCLGTVSFNTSFNNTSAKVEFAIVSLDASTVIGLPSSVDLKIVNPKPSGDQTKNMCASIKSEEAPKPEEADFIQPFPTDVISQFPGVFENKSVGMIKGDPYNIKLKTDAIPAVDAARALPFALTKKVNQELNRMEALGVISKVEQPTEWVNSMAVVIRGEKVRICLDPKRLNDAIMREHVRLPTTDEILASIGSAKFFTKLDLKDGYWQVPLTEQASYLTTFNSSCGRWRYNRLPFGLNSANEVFQKRVSQVFENLPGLVVLFDDILIYGENEMEHDNVLQQALERCKNSGIKLNTKKCKYKVKEVKYLGHIITSEGIKIDNEKVRAIKQMPKPTDKKAVQRLLGAVNQMSKFVPNLATITHPIRQLLNKNVIFDWNHEQNEALDKIKQCLTSAPVLGYYDVNQDVTISCDASGTGIGACLIQNKQPIAYASRSLTEIELSYSPIEKEMLGIVYSCDRFYQFVYAKKVTVESDHKPFVDIFKKPFHSNPARLQRFLIRLQRYDLNVVYVPGKEMFVADMLSRASINLPLSDDEKELQDDYKFLISTVIKNLNCSEKMRERIVSETKNDIILSKVIHYVHNGWPESSKICHPNAKAYWTDRNELSFENGYLLFHDRIVIPKVLQAEVLNRIHEGHQGQERCKALARNAVYWRGITGDIERVVSSCEQCLLRRKAPAHEPLIPHEIPEKPWHKVASDIFSYAGSKYQIIVDYYSKWVEVEAFQAVPKSTDVIKHLKSVFCRFGFPKTFCSDGDSIYTSSEFDQFCRKYEFDHIFSSAGYPRSNGQVERKIQFIKDMIIKSGTENLDAALLQYRNTPLGADLDSPAKLLLNRNLKSRIPVFEDNPSGKTFDMDMNLLALKKRQLEAKAYHDKSAPKEHNRFISGDLVRYRDNLRDKLWNKEGQIIKAINPRSYELLNSKGNVVRRNRNLLQADATRNRLVADTADYMANVNTTPPTDPPAHVQPDTPYNPTLSTRPINLQPLSENPELRRSERLKAKVNHEPPIIPRRSERLKYK